MSVLSRVYNVQLNPTVGSRFTYIWEAQVANGEWSQLGLALYT